jgi:hypothetical protein
MYRRAVPQVKITVFEGERAKVEDNSPLGTFDLTGGRLCLLCPLRLPRCLLLDLPAHSTQSVGYFCRAPLLPPAGIPPAPRGIPKIKVSFSIDANGGWALFFRVFSCSLIDRCFH